MLLLLPLQGISSASFSFPESPEKKNKLIGTRYRTVRTCCGREIVDLSPPSALLNSSLYNRVGDWDPSHQTQNLERKKRKKDRLFSQHSANIQLL